jgi:hypothetical protein
LTLDLALVVRPRHAELDDALGLDQTRQNLLVVRFALEEGLQALQDLFGRLEELILVRILLLEVLEDLVDELAHFLLFAR